MADELTGFQEHLVKSYKELLNIDELDIRLLDYELQNHLERREFVKHILYVSAGVIAATQFLALEKHSFLFFAGCIFYLCIAILSTLYLRENIDLDGRDIILMQDHIGSAKKEVRVIIEQAIRGNRSPENYNEKLEQGLYVAKKKYLEDKNEIPSFMDYSTELFSFLFLQGSAFILLSYILKNIDIYNIGLIAFLLLIAFILWRISFGYQYLKLARSLNAFVHKK